jgi:hypothetical protein
MARRADGAKAKDIRARMTNTDLASLPSVEEVPAAEAGAAARETATTSGAWW